MKSSIQKGATGTCTAAFHVIGSQLHNDRQAEHLEMLHTGECRAAIIDDKSWSKAQSGEYAEADCKLEA